jgi:hypothetical protein
MNSRNKAILSLGAIFLLGIIIGILIDSQVFNHSRRGQRDRGHPNLLEIFTKKLELSSQQQGKLKELLDNFKTKFQEVGTQTETQFRKVREEFNEQFMLILNGTQKEKYKKMVDEFEKREHHR